MKLYTEEQVIKMIEKSRETGLTAEFLILTTPPIELPSDEEIWDMADEIWGRADSEQSDVRHLAFMQSAKWMRDKIQGGEK
jgi:hypothetical protein